MRNYRADVTLTADGDGTRIAWAGTYDPKWPGTGAVLAKVLNGMMQRFADDAGPLRRRPWPTPSSA